MITTNNREVVLRSVINQPVLGGSSSTSVTGGASTTAAISYLPIGTVINILPKKMTADKVNLNIAITVSSIISTAIIQGNPYPVASSRVYSAPVEVSGGYTVAIGGLDEAKEQVTDQGVPVLNKIPVLGWLFKTQSKQKNHKNLMLFITPSLIDDKGGGLPNLPEAVLPKKPDAFMPAVPRIAADGGLQGGVQAVPNAVAFLRRSSQEIGQIIQESRGTKDEYLKISDLMIAIRRIRGVVENYDAQYPAYAAQLKQYQWELSKLLEDLERSRIALMRRGYY
jgi:Flp pilus assembly secretin CpaC